MIDIQYFTAVNRFPWTHAQDLMNELNISGGIALSKLVKLEEVSLGLRVVMKKLHRLSKR